MTGIVDDLETRLTQLSDEKPIAEWRELVTLTAPALASEFDFEGKKYDGSAYTDAVRTSRRSEAARKSERRYDDTAVWLNDRLASAMESLTTPKASRWHGIGFQDPLEDDPNDAERKWLDKFERFLFSARYNPNAGFALNNQLALAHATKLGTGVLYIEENQNLSQVNQPVFYRHVPLWQANIGTDSRGRPNTFMWEKHLTPPQALEAYGDKVSDKVKGYAEDPKSKNKRIWFVHAIIPRDNGVPDAQDITKSMFESIVYERDTKHIVKTSGYFEFPLAISYWHREGTNPYGVAQASLCLPTIKTLNKMALDQMAAASQVTRPPTATGKTEQAPNLNAGKNNPGFLDEQGRLLVQPILTGNPQAAEPTIERVREQLREMMFGNLFQVLMDQGGAQTATEVLQRAREKADMIGPYASNHQAAMSMMFDREYAIMGRRGAFDEGAPLEAPESVMQKSVTPRYSAPIDRYRQYGDVENIQAALAAVSNVAALHPEVIDNIDPDETYEAIMESLNVPASMSRNEEDVQNIRAARQQAQQQAEQMAMMQQAAAAGKDGAQAMKDMGYVENAQ